MKKFLLLLCSLLLIAVGIKADVTVTWESYPGWVRNDVASIWWVGITTPGTTNDTYKMSEFQFAQETGYGAATRYACISKTGPTTSGAVLDESDVLGVSTNAVTASATEYYTYNLANEIENSTVIKINLDGWKAFYNDKIYAYITSLETFLSVFVPEIKKQKDAGLYPNPKLTYNHKVLKNFILGGIGYIMISFYDFAIGFIQIKIAEEF